MNVNGASFEVAASPGSFDPYVPLPEMEPWVHPPESSTLWGAETRMAHLESLPAYGFTDEQHSSVVDKIVSIGLPVNNYASLHRRPNTIGRENVLGSWGTGSAVYGEFSVYELLDRQIPEQVLATIGHEGLHANTPLNPDNDHLYGGEAKRQEAETHVWEVMRQSQATGIHLNGYHKALLAQHAAGEISESNLAEETFAIMGEMALSNRNGLLEVQERQHDAMIDVNRIRRLQGQPTLENVSLISAEGSDVKEGIDQVLVNLIDGIETIQGLRDHVHDLKAKLYSAENFDTVSQREILRGYVSADSLLIPALVAYLENLRKDEIREDDE